MAKLSLDSAEDRVVAPRPKWHRKELRDRAGRARSRRSRRIILAATIAFTLGLGACLGLVKPQDATAAVPPSFGRDCEMLNEAGLSTLVTRWNVAALEAICQMAQPTPTAVSRILFMLHVAMYDAWTAFDASARPVHAKVEKWAAGDDAAAKAEALSFAALEALFTQLPEQQDIFFERLAAEGLSEETYVDPPAGSPAALGIAVAKAVEQARRDDGANAADGYRDTTGYKPVNPPERSLSDIDPNRWQPLLVPDLRPEFAPDDFDPVRFDATDFPHWVAQSFVTPHWGTVTPFALDATDQLRPLPPPRYGDDSPYTDALGRRITAHQAWVDQFTEVMLLQSRLTEEQKVIAQVFSQDGPYYGLPAGQWNFFAQQVSLRDRHSLDKDVKVFFALNAAMLDAGIAAWDAKRTYDFIRPITAIRFLFQGSELFGWRGPGKGFGPVAAEDWHPYQWTSVVSPAHAEYVSGHSTFCAAGGVVLREMTGSDRFHDASVIGGDYNKDGVGEPIGTYVMKAGEGLFDPDAPSRDVTLVWQTFTEAVEQCGMGRLYDGVHIMDSNLRGQDMGRAAGNHAMEKARVMWEGR